MGFSPKAADDPTGRDREHQDAASRHAVTDFEAISDWPQYLRDAIERPADHLDLSWLNQEATTPAAVLSALFGELSPAARARMADGAVTLIEAGNPAHAKAVMAIGLEQAPRAAARIAAAVRSHRFGYDDLLVDGLLDHGLQSDARELTLVAAVEDEARRRGPRMLQLMAFFRADWVSSRLSLVPTASDPDGKLLLRVVDRTRTPDLPLIVDAIAAAGQDYVDRLVSALGTWSESARARVGPALAAHKAFTVGA